VTKIHYSVQLRRTKRHVSLLELFGRFHPAFSSCRMSTNYKVIAISLRLLRSMPNLSRKMLLNLLPLVISEVARHTEFLLTP
jgi:hypothetical protein